MAVTFKLSKGANKPTISEQAKAKAPGDKVSWMRRGPAAADAMKKDDARVSRLQEQSSKLWRFYIGTKHIDEEFLVTFLDGELGDDGMLAIPMWYEHRIQHAGKWENFVCTESIDKSTPCPICAMPEKGSEAALVGAVTIIDHTPYITKNNKKVQHRKKLFVMKRKTLKQLRKIAAKRGGLTGVTMEITRTGDMSANVGDMFEFHSKNSLPDIAEGLKDELGKEFKPDIIKPADYDAEVIYYTAAELLEMGVGQHTVSVGGETGVSAKVKAEM